MSISDLWAEAERAVRNYFGALDDPLQRQNHLSGVGPVAELEEQLERHYRLPYGLCLSNATTALQALAMALGLREAEFIAPPFTYGASLSGWLLHGNRPVFADIDSETLTLDLEATRRAVSAQTRALLAVDMYGVPCDMYGLRELADEFGLWFVVDGAQSLGACIRGEPAGRLADALVVSFTAGKPVFAGEGAAILTSNRELYEKLVWLTQHPLRQVRELGPGRDNEFGLNGRIHPLSAVWAGAVLGRSLDLVEAHRIRCFQVLDALRGYPPIEPMDLRGRGLEPTFFRLTAARRGRARPADIEDYLADRDLSYRVAPASFRLLYRQPAFLVQYSDWALGPGGCPRAEDQERRRFVLVAPPA